MAVDSNKIISDYLQRVELELEGVPTARQHELLTDLREHIEAERASLREESAADVLRIINRLGDPSRIAAAARDDGRTSLEADLSAPRPGGVVLWVRIHWKLLLAAIFALIVALTLVVSLFFAATDSGTVPSALQNQGVTFLDRWL